MKFELKDIFEKSDIYYYLFGAWGLYHMILVLNRL